MKPSIKRWRRVKMYDDYWRFAIDPMVFPTGRVGHNHIHTAGIRFRAVNELRHPKSKQILWRAGIVFGKRVSVEKLVKHLRRFADRIDRFSKNKHFYIKGGAI